MSTQFFEKNKNISHYLKLWKIYLQRNLEIKTLIYLNPLGPILTVSLGIFES